MTDSDLALLETKKTRLLAEMMDYINESETEEFEAPYSATEVQTCDVFLGTFNNALRTVHSKSSESEILKCVERLVLSLNALNDKVGGALIETNQREDLCDYILCAAKAAGLNRDDDITEEWRNW